MSGEQPRTPSGWDPRMYASFAVMLRASAAGVESSRLHERDGLVATICPAARERSVFNSVAYSEPEALEAELGRLAAAHDEAGVDAWTVWVPDTDRRSAALLEAAGHRLDAEPRAMLLDLAELGEPDLGDLDWSAAGSLEDLTRINDAAYGYEPGTFARGIGTPPAGTYEIYEARLEGEPASVVATIDHEGDCGIWWVATLPDAQGRGLAVRLLHLALDAARARGCTTSTLEASGAGYPVYERLGYRELGRLEMWELRREPAPG